MFTKDNILIGLILITLLSIGGLTYLTYKEVKMISSFELCKTATPIDTIVP